MMESHSPCPPSASRAACEVGQRIAGSADNLPQGRRDAPTAKPEKPQEKNSLCPNSSRIECLASLAEPAKPGTDSPDWTLPMLQAWATKVGDALEADLRWRWTNEAIGVKLHIALSTAIGFFLALAALIAWQIRSACEDSDVPPHPSTVSANSAP
jgi:hypothetical protein